ncbi:hypothetical protein [Sandaracinus amylolyticus]|uniref:hypothetical protein n=1 Tax=Sandaracinus amylolyticus TaxID=927083 RepID=UPI001F414412|nr:hypothetical protein [Sandaracinus amylolyticus]
MRRLLSADHELSCSWFLWWRLLAGLRARGGGMHESGAFLLGHRDDGRARISMFVLYDDLDPHCLDTGIVHFDGRYFGRLWDLCKATGLAVVADVHTHPGGARQSGSDRAHPMIACAGHLALIVPRFALPPVRVRDVGIYRYLGAKRWATVPSRHFRIGL